MPTSDSFAATANRLLPLRSRCLVLLRARVAAVPTLGDCFTCLAHDGSALDALSTLVATEMPLAAIVAMVGDRRFTERTVARLLSRSVTLSFLSAMQSLTGTPK